MPGIASVPGCGKCMMCGNDKKAFPCLIPGLKVSEFSGRGALLVTRFGYWGLGSLDWHYIIYCRQQVIKINVLTSPDFADDAVVRGGAQDTNGVGECDSRWLWP